MTNENGKHTTPSFWYGTASQRLVECMYWCNATVDVAAENVAYWYNAN